MHMLLFAAALLVFVVFALVLRSIKAVRHPRVPDDQQSGDRGRRQDDRGV